MSKNNSNKNKIETLKRILKSLHEGESLEDLKRKFKDVLEAVSPSEIPLVEQELIKEGVPISELLRLCDLHVELLRESLRSRELKGVPKGHPVDLLSRENTHIAKLARTLSIYAEALSKAVSGEKTKYLEAISDVVAQLRRARLHYRKIQMLIFPYLERRGITAVPRVLWGREDQAMVKLRGLQALIERGLNKPEEYSSSVAEKAGEIAGEIFELIFREEKILLPAVWALLSEGEWAAIHEIAEEMGYLVPVEGEWAPKAEPLLPYQIKGTVTAEQLEKLPQEFRFAAQAALTPDTYKVKSGGDLEFETGFLSRGEAEALFRHLPLEMTYADAEGRVKFFSQSVLGGGFVRAKTIIGRRFEYCHPPRLERMVKSVVEELKSGKSDFREYWTRLGNRVIRVLVVAVKDKGGKYLGTLEMVEDLTDIINNPEEIKRKVVVL